MFHYIDTIKLSSDNGPTPYEHPLEFLFVFHQYILYPYLFATFL